MQFGYFTPKIRNFIVGGAIATKIGKKVIAEGRLDHIWVTPDLVRHVVAAGIAKNVRSWELPSDHVPVWIDLDLDN